MAGTVHSQHSIKIREVGPREGFQTAKKIISTKDKLQLIELLALTGVSEIEITSMVRPDRVPQMADADEVIEGVQAHDGVRFTALYLNRTGFERAQKNKKITNGGWITSAASAAFLKENSNTTHQDILKSLPEWLTLFSKYGTRLEGLMLSTAFGCNYEGAISSEQVIRVISSTLDSLAGLSAALPEVCLADTMGWATPRQVRELVGAVRRNFPAITVSLHLHDTRGTGLANAYAGLEEGVTTFDASVGGIGGCPFAKGAAGNVATEEFVYLCHSLGLQTGIDLERYLEAARYAETIMGFPLPSKLLRSGLPQTC